MKIFVWLITALNLWFGGYNFLNAVGVLRSAKYAQVTTVIFGVLFLCMGVYGAYTAYSGTNLKLALWLGIGPWLLAIVVMFLAMITGSQQ